MRYVCKRCGSVDHVIKMQDKQVGMWCADCGRWIKWLNKEEKRELEKNGWKEERIREKLMRIRNEINDILDEL